MKIDSNEMKETIDAPQNSVLSIQPIGQWLPIGLSIQDRTGQDQARIG